MAFVRVALPTTAAHMRRRQTGRHPALLRMLQTPRSTPTTTNNHIRLVASDVDGTLLDSRHRIAPRTLEAIRAMRTKGVLFVPATGKSRGGVRNALGDLGRELTDPKGGLSVGGVYLQARAFLVLFLGWGVVRPPARGGLPAWPHLSYVFANVLCGVC